MKKIYNLIFILLIAASASAQDFQWAGSAGLWAYDYGYGIGTDAAGNIYVAGKYEEDGAVFGNTTVQCAGNHDVFVAKYSPSGVFQWVRTGGGDMGDYAHGMTVDAAGNVYIAGEIDGDSYFGTTFVDANPGTDDIVVAKYNTNGDLLWVKDFGGYHRDDARGIAVDGSGNIFIVGVFRNAAMFGSITINAASTDVDDAFVAKLDPNGNPIWAKQIGGAGDDTGKGIGVDAAGNVYVTGGFMGTATFGSTTVVGSSTDFRDMYLAKFDNNGALQWVKKTDGTYDEVGWGIAVDALGNSYVTGEYHADPYFGTQQLIAHGNGDAFVVKYDAAGNMLWASTFGDDLVDRARGVAVGAGKVYITGQYGGTVTHGSSTITAKDSSDIFVAAFDANTGAAGWVVRTFGTADTYEPLGYEAGNAIAADASGKVYVTGSYLGDEKLNHFLLEDWSRTDIFIGVIDQGIPPGTEGISELANAHNVKAFPNPSEGEMTISFEAARGNSYEVKITNAIGQVVFAEAVRDFTGEYRKNLDLSAFGNGIFFLEVAGGGMSGVRKVVMH